MHVDASRDALSGHLLFLYLFLYLYAPCVLFYFIFFPLTLANSLGGGGRGILLDFRFLLVFYIFPVQQTKSGIGHRVKVIFSGWQPIC